LTITVLALCVPNVRAASTSKLATATHPDTGLLIKVVDKNGNEISTTQANQPYLLIGLLAYGPRDVIPNPIGGAKIHVYGSFDGSRWLGPIDATTATNGLFAVNFPDGQNTPTGTIYYKVTYDGGDQYAPCVSNVVQVTTV